MDYLDTPKEFRQRILLFIGYILIAIAIVTTTLLLVYWAYGYNFNKKGALIQEGLVFLSSQPSPANIYVNGRLNSATTNTRLFIASGVYHFELTRAGYRNWTRTVTVDGGAVEHFDYPLLIPNKLKSSNIETFAAAPGLLTESVNQNWIIIQKPGSSTDFDLYDISSNKPVESNLSLPSTILGKAVISESWKLGEWSDDNKHVLLEHIYDGNIEYILLDRSDPTQSVNLSTTYNLSNTSALDLINDKYNNYYIYNSATQVLSTATLGTSTVTPVLQHVISYKSYGNNTVLYVTNDGGSTTKVMVKLFENGKTYDIRTLPVSSTYLLNLTTYSGTPYVAVGSNAANKVYIYQDPVSQLNQNSSTNGILVPIWVLNVSQPNYLSFSDNAQFIMAENGTSYAVYDIENNLGYNYNDTEDSLDAPQLNASWMDGDRLIYVSSGKLILQDYDNNNRQTLVDASPGYLPAFSSNYDYLYTLKGLASGQYQLQQTPLLTPADL
jgi:hypothetical protein